MRDKEDKEHLADAEVAEDVLVVDSVTGLKTLASDSDPHAAAMSDDEEQQQEPSSGSSSATSGSSENDNDNDLDTSTETAAQMPQDADDSQQQGSGSRRDSGDDNGWIGGETTEGRIHRDGIELV